MTILTVIAGGLDTGKSLVAEALRREKGYVWIARDDVRNAMPEGTDEWEVTIETFRAVSDHLKAGRDVVASGWNLDPADREGWILVARRAKAELRWITCEMVETNNV